MMINYTHIFFGDDFDKLSFIEEFNNPRVSFTLSAACFILETTSISLSLENCKLIKAHRF